MIDKKLLDDLILILQFNGKIELDLKQSLSDIDKQNILINDIIEIHFDKPMREERQKMQNEELEKYNQITKKENALKTLGEQTKERLEKQRKEREVESDKYPDDRTNN